MPRREDWKIIKHLHKNNQRLKDIYLSYPYLYISKYDYDNIYKSNNDFIPEGFTVNDLLNLVPFTEMAFYLEDDVGAYNISLDISHAKEHIDKLAQDVTIHDIDSTGLLPWHKFPCTSFLVNIKDNAVATFARWPTIDDMVISSYTINDLITSKDIDFDIVKKRHFIESISSIVTTLVSSLIFAAVQDMYPVEVTKDPRTVRHNKYTAKKKPWTREDWTRIIYMNKLPQDKDNNDPAHTGRTVSGHMRRGHWRRLKDERYKNHPKYGSTIRVRPTWIGPENVNYRGASYKLLGDIK